jgi:threonine dehydratase
MNFDRLRHVAERAELGERREALLAVAIPERPGSFLAFCRAIGERQITEFNYRFAEPDQAQVFVGGGVGSRRRGACPVDRPTPAPGVGGAGHDGQRDREVAPSLHGGGHAPGAGESTGETPGETVVRFEFPERPGALLDLLTEFGIRWNITLFHYRNHGAAYGRVLMGATAPQAEQADFRRSLDALGYPHWEETDN